MKRPTVFAALLLVMVLPFAGRGEQVFQRVPFGSPPNPVGSGARAIAWGGAFIAVSDDATAASWNPAGLIQLIEPEASVALSYHNRLEQFTFDGYDSDADSVSLASINLNYASVVYPFHVGELNMVASLNYQRLYEFDRSLEYSTTGVTSGGEPFISDVQFDQIGALTTLTPAFAIQVTPAWSMGLSVNFWGLDGTGNGWDQQMQIHQVLNPGAVNEVNTWVETRENYQLTGTNFVIGTHYKIQNLTIGAVYKTSFDADVRYESSDDQVTINQADPGLTTANFTNRQRDEKLTMPESYGIGLAYRYSDRLSFALDGYSTRWSRYAIHTGDGDLNLITGDTTSTIEDTVQVRGGAEYLWITPKYVFALRGGAFYDPEPRADGISEVYGTAIGGGLVYQNFVIDAALQYRFGQDLPGERVENVQSKTDMQEYLGIVSLIYHF